MSNRRTQCPARKAKVAMEAISGRKTLQEIAADHVENPNQLSQWKKQAIEATPQRPRGTSSGGYLGSCKPPWLACET
jgi:transposase-like protein